MLWCGLNNTHTCTCTHVHLPDHEHREVRPHRMFLRIQDEPHVHAGELLIIAVFHIVPVGEGWDRKAWFSRRSTRMRGSPLGMLHTMLPVVEGSRLINITDAFIV